MSVLFYAFMFQIQKSNLSNRSMGKGMEKLFRDAVHQEKMSPVIFRVTVHTRIFQNLKCKNEKSMLAILAVLAYYESQVVFYEEDYHV